METGANRIPLFDLRVEPDDLAAVEQVLRSGRLAAGERTAAFERVFADHVGARHAIAVANCTAALHLAYLAAGVRPGDEVIVPAFTFVATASAVVHCGATPVFAEVVGTHDLGIDPDDVERRITPRTRAVTAVHFAGYPAAVDRLRVLCQERGLALIEDAAHAPSATLGGRHVGTFGLAATFSLYSNKVLTSGEGGVLTTDDDDVAASVRSMLAAGVERDPAEDGGWQPAVVGFDYRFDDLRAALVLSRMERLEADLERRRALVVSYRRALADLPGVIVPYTDADVKHSSCYVMPVLVRDPARRDAVRVAMREQGIETSVLYPAIHELAAYRGRYSDLSLPRTELCARSEITLPLYPELEEADLEAVVAALTAALA